MNFKRGRTKERKDPKRWSAPKQLHMKPLPDEPRPAKAKKAWSAKVCKKTKGDHVFETTERAYFLGLNIVTDKCTLCGKIKCQSYKKAEEKAQTDLV